MKKRSIALLALAATLAVVPFARADSFGFSFTDSGGVSASGTLYGTFESPGLWLLDSGSGTFTDGVNSGAINLVANPNGPGGSTLNPDASFAYTDLLTLFNGPNQYIDVQGLYFTFGSIDLNLYQNGGGPGTDGWYENNGNGDQVGTFAITSADIPASETPEPGSLLLLGSGLCALAVVLRRRKYEQKCAFEQL